VKTLAANLIVPPKPSMLLAVIVAVVEPPVVKETKYALVDSPKFGPLTTTSTDV